MRWAWLALLLVVPSTLAAVSPQQHFEAPSGQFFGRLIEARDGHALIGADPTVAPLLGGGSPNGPGGMWFYGAEGGQWRQKLSFGLETCTGILTPTGLRPSYSNSFAIGSQWLVHANPCAEGAPPDELLDTVVDVADEVNQGRAFHWSFPPLKEEADVVMPSDGADRVYFGLDAAAGDGWWATTWQTSHLLRTAGGTPVTEDEVSFIHVGIYNGGPSPAWQQTAGPYTSGQTPPSFTVTGFDHEIRVVHPDGTRWALDARTMEEVPWTNLPPGSGKDGITARVVGREVIIAERTPLGWVDTDRFTIDHALTPYGSADADVDTVAVGLQGIWDEECPSLFQPCTYTVEEPGHVLVYHRTADGWVLHEDIAGPRIAGDGFGAAVAVTGHHVIIGAPGTDEARDMWGRAYVRTMNQWPTAAFHWTSNPAPYTFDKTPFISTSTDPEGHALTLSWDFDGDGETDATGAEVSWTWERPGLFPVTLTALDTQEGKDTVTHFVFVRNRAPSTDFFPTPTPVWRTAATVWENYAFDPDGSIVSCFWDFGDGRTSTECEPTLSYPTKGTYPVTLVTCDDGDEQAPPQQALCSTKTRSIQVFNHKPVIELGVVGEPVTGTPFTVEVTAGDPDGTIVNQGWSDGSAAGSRSITAIRPGILRVGYEATDDEGDRAVAWLDVDVANRAPTIGFQLPSDRSTQVPLPFVDASSDPDGRITGWSWDFGDGNSSADRQPRHTYAQKGTYIVSLQVRDDFGALSERVEQVLVIDNDAPVPRIGASIQDGMVEVTDLSFDPDGAVVARTWYLDGQTVEPTFPWTLELPDPAKRLTLEVTDDRGTRQNATIYLGVVPEPEPEPEPLPPLPATSTETAAPFIPEQVAVPEEPETAGTPLPDRGNFPWFVLVVAFVLVSVVATLALTRLRR